uniref:Uncharacterized protein n=1 Tax=Anguilla anguilla TaxID=7936 RepID=A0A0E9S9Y5_ANGAN
MMIESAVNHQLSFKSSENHSAALQICFKLHYFFTKQCVHCITFTA